jgi:excisionase family DNA binding protein
MVESKRIAVGDTQSLMTVSEVAAYLRMSAAWVRQHAGGLRLPIVPSVKMGKAVRFRRAAVVEFVQAMERTERTT